MKFSDLQVYKHDVVGKLTNISKLVEPISENDFISKASDDVFICVHETILKMLRTSKKTMLIRNKEPIQLIVSDKVPKSDLEVIKIENILVRISNGDSLSYYYFLVENSTDLLFALGKLDSFLPIAKFLSDVQDSSVSEIINRLRKA